MKYVARKTGAGLAGSMSHKSHKSNHQTTRHLLYTGLLSAGLLLAGCKDFNKQSMDEAQRDAQVQAQAQAVADAVKAQAARLEAIRQQEALRRQQEPPVVTWLSTDSLHRPASETDKKDKPAVSANTSNDLPDANSDTAAASAANVSVEPVKNTTHAPTLAQDDKSSDALLTQLLLAQRREQGDALNRAVNIAAILGMTGKSTFDPRDLETLSEPQKNRLTHYQKLIALLREQALSPGTATQYQTVLEHLDSLMDDVPLHIRKVEIARSVSSFGVYEAMETRTFLAGRPQPMIVYVELEHFKAIKGESGKFAVKLAQELVLYNEADGLAVWREPRVQITDESMNRRRDFFVVQRIELPARLGVGKYLLKVTMSDMQGGSIDETSVPIQVVADVTMVKKP